MVVGFRFVLHLQVRCKKSKIPVLSPAEDFINWHTMRSQQKQQALKNDFAVFVFHFTKFLCRKGKGTEKIIIMVH